MGVGGVPSSDTLGAGSRCPAPRAGSAAEELVSALHAPSEVLSEHLLPGLPAGSQRDGHGRLPGMQDAVRVQEGVAEQLARATQGIQGSARQVRASPASCHGLPCCPTLHMTRRDLAQAGQAAAAAQALPRVSSAGLVWHERELGRSKPVAAPGSCSTRGVWGLLGSVAGVGAGSLGVARRLTCRCLRRAGRVSTQPPGMHHAGGSA